MTTPIPDDMPCCRNCAFAVGTECRRNAPEARRGPAVWPTIKASDWCGEWQPHPTAAHLFQQQAGARAQRPAMHGDPNGVDGTLRIERD